MKEGKLIDAIEEMVDKMVEAGGKPYAIICSRKTFEKVALYFRKLSPIEEKSMPRQIWFKYEGGDLPVFKFRFCPEDKIHVVDKDTFDRLMWENKERQFAATTYIGIEALPLDEQKRAKKTHSVFDKYPCEALKRRGR